MTKILRCSRCFAPKEHPDDTCSFCGLNPREERRIAEFSDDLLEKEPLPDGLSLDEKIIRLRVRRHE